MAELQAFPFDAIEQLDGSFDREFSSIDWATYFGMFIGNGIYAQRGNCCQVQADNSTMFLKVKSGAVFINGRCKEWVDDQSLRLSNSDAAYNRYDLIVARLDLVNRDITLEVVEGTASANPVIPSLTQTADIYELCLAQVLVRTGTLYIAQGDVTDKRYTSLCGFVKGYLDQLDAESFFDQYDLQLKQTFDDYDKETDDHYKEYETKINALYEQYTAAWAEWFSHIKGVLDADAAGALQEQIDQLKYIYAKDETLYLPNTFNSVTGETLFIGNI